MRDLLVTTTQHRKSTGMYENRSRKSKKSPSPPPPHHHRRSLRLEAPLRNTTESPTTTSGARVTTRHAHGRFSVMKLVMVGLYLSSMVPVEGMEHGTPVFKNQRADTLVPLLRMKSGHKIHECSALRLNTKQVLTAKHCVHGIANTGITIPSKERGIQSASQVRIHPTADIAIVDFPSDLPGPNVCPPEVMKKPAYKRMVANEAKGDQKEKPCGLNGNLLILGRGMKSQQSAPSGSLNSALTSGVFKNDDFDYANNRLIVSGASPEQSLPKILNGDSGGPVFACNSRTKAFELLGSVSLIDPDPAIDRTMLSNIADHREIFSPTTQKLRAWVRQNANDCVGEAVSAYELHPSDDNLKQNYPEPKNCVDISVHIKTDGEVDLVVDNSCPDSTKNDIFITHSKSRKKITSILHRDQATAFSTNLNTTDTQFSISTKSRYV